MTRKLAIGAAFGALVVICGCSRDQDAGAVGPSEAAMATSAAPDAVEAAIEAAETAPAGSDAAGADQAAIPPAIRGRWGLVPADCTSTRGDAKGLLVIGPDSMRFYEATATLGSVSAVGADRLRAEFAYTGEGQQWTREQSLTVADAGKTLTRREFGQGAMPQLRYTRCP